MSCLSTARILKRIWKKIIEYIIFAKLKFENLNSVSELYKIYRLIFCEMK